MSVSLIIGITLLFVPISKEYFNNLYTWLFTALQSLENTQLTSYNYPLWILLSIFIFLLICIIVVYIIFKKHSKPQYLTYVEDSIYNTTWRWKWEKNQISNLQCYCPNCDSILVYDDTSCHTSYTDLTKTDFICESCKSQLITSIHGGNKNYAFNAIKREIERRIKIKEYK